MKRKIVSLALIIVLSFASGAVFASGGLKIVVNGIPASVQGKVIDGSTYVPLRAVATMLGAQVSYDSKTKVVNINAGTKTQETATATKGVEFLDLQVKDLSGLWKISVEVKNEGTTDINRMSFKIVFYDEKGSRVGTADGYINNKLGVGESVVVETISTDDLSNYKTVKYQVER